MKKVLFTVAVVSAVVLTSCKKEHTCTCTTTTSYAGGSSTSTSSVTYKDVTKKNAKTLCVSSTQTDATTGATSTSDCSLAD